MRVGEICTRDVVFYTPDTSIAEATLTPASRANHAGTGEIEDDTKKR